VGAQAAGYGDPSALKLSEVEELWICVVGAIARFWWLRCGGNGMVGYTEGDMIASGREEGAKA
jgi:hypothetical protein